MYKCLVLSIHGEIALLTPQWWKLNFCTCMSTKGLHYTPHKQHGYQHWTGNQAVLCLAGLQHGHKIEFLFCIAFWIKSTNVLMPRWSCRRLVHTECTYYHTITWLLAATHMHRFVHSSRTVGVGNVRRRLSNTMSTCTIWACALARLRHHNAWCIQLGVPWLRLLCFDVLVLEISLESPSILLCR